MLHLSEITQKYFQRSFMEGVETSSRLYVTHLGKEFREQKPKAQSFVQVFVFISLFVYGRVFVHVLVCESECVMHTR